MLQPLIDLIEDESGATAVEYGLIGALLVVTAVGSISELGESIANIFLRVQTTIDSVVTP
ncbi:MAG: Flp family type IVb pilin [Rhodospirillaceae bacterium]|jgi:pilus assembly protein Flp/PilA|nr:Flp family type IVb pilin [Rhodospirillaceae bacterium]MBT5458250.1 Flp family type IVb pilin [Rhodospirillaceae bacterium]